MTADYQSLYRSRSDTALASIWHLSQAMRLLHRDLGTSTVPQDSSVAVAISLTIRATLRGSTKEGRIHLLGLKRMLELRPGGLVALRVRAAELVNKIRRADMELALSEGTLTVFGSQPLPATDHVIPLDSRGTFAMPYPVSEACTTVQCAMRDVLALCCYAGHAQLDPFQYQDTVISIAQRLVDYAPLGGARPSCQIDDVCQLGVMAFMATILYRIPHKRQAYTKLLNARLMARLGMFDDSKAYGHEHQYPSLRLWFVFVSALMAPEFERCRDADSAIVQNIRAVAEFLNLRSWDDTRAHLTLYPWITTFHDQPGRKLWESAIQN